jgi:hypothetical protein
MNGNRGPKGRTQKILNQKKEDKLVFFIRAYPPLDLGFIKMPKVVPKIPPHPAKKEII